MTNKHFTFHKLQNVIKSSLLLKPGMEHGIVNEMKHRTRNRTYNGTWKLEHAMENLMGYRMEPAE